MTPINTGDRVSWRLDIDGYPRLYGFVVPHIGWANSKTEKHAFHIRGDDGTYRLIPCRFITKEVDQCTTE